MKKNLTLKACLSLFFLMSFAAQACCASLFPPPKALQQPVDELRISKTADRNKSSKLTSATLSTVEKVYVFYRATKDSSPITQVGFMIDGKWYATDYTPPYDLNPTRDETEARPFDLSTLGPGVHEILSIVHRGEIRTETRDFIVVTNPDESPVSYSQIPDPCARFKPGHYIRILKDSTRSLDSKSAAVNILSKIRNKLGDGGVAHFGGFALQINWGDIERDDGSLDYSAIDDILKIAEENDKFVILKIMERTFLSGCESRFIPTRIPRSPARDTLKACYATTWNDDTADELIDLYRRVIEHYSDVSGPGRRIIGFVLSETALPASDMSGTDRLTYYTSLLRIANAIHALDPTFLVAQYINWPQDANFNGLILNNMSAWGSGNAFGWPDSVPDHETTWLQYDLAKENRQSFAIMPSAQLALIDPRETPEVFDMLTRIGSHIVIWEGWAAGYDYLDDILLNTLDEKGWNVNTTCPYAGNSLD